MLNARITMTAVRVALLLTVFAGTAFADSIDFESQCPSGVQASGACSTTFVAVGNASSVNVSTSIGTVGVQGGGNFR